MAEKNVRNSVHDSFEKRSSVSVSDNQQSQIIQQMINNVKTQNSTNNSSQNK